MGIWNTGGLTAILTKLPILDFIKEFKRGFNEDELIRVFTCGNCYHFAIILNNIYDGEIVYDQIVGHFMFKHEDKYYDITGEVKDIKDAQYLRHIQIDDRLLYDRLIAQCVYLKNGL